VGFRVWTDSPEEPLCLSREVLGAGKKNLTPCSLRELCERRSYLRVLCAFAVRVNNFMLSSINRIIMVRSKPKEEWTMNPYGRVNLPFSGIASLCKFPIHTDLETLSADVAIFGIPWDEGVGYRPGARFGPRSIREYSTRFAFHERAAKEGGYWNIDDKKRYLDGIRLVDCGDQDVLYLNVEQTFSAITESVRKIISAKAFPVIL
jgi:hypothetical protein